MYIYKFSWIVDTVLHSYKLLPTAASVLFSEYWHASSVVPHFQVSLRRLQRVMKEGEVRKHLNLFLI
jgi:hypothetical protein